MRETDDRGLFWRWGLWIYRRRNAVLLLWLLMTFALAGFAVRTPGILTDSGFTPEGSGSQQGLLRLQEKLGAAQSTVDVMYVSERDSLQAGAHSALLADSLQSVREFPYVIDIKPIAANRLPDAKPNVTGVAIGLSLDTDEAAKRYPELRDAIRSTVPAGYQAYITGGPPVIYEMQAATRSDIIKAEAIGLPIAMLVLLLVFGTAAAAMLPLVVGLVSVSVTLGLIYFIAQGMTLSNLLPNMVTMLGLAVGIDYALFMVSRFREELRKLGSAELAAAVTTGTAGKSIFFSGVAVLVGLFGMLFIDLSVYRSLCLGGVLVVTVSVAVALTLLPALLGMMGSRIEAFRILPASWGARDISGGAAWSRIAYAVMRRPLLLVAAVAAALLLLMRPLPELTLAVPSAEVLPPAYESRYGADLLKSTYDERETNPLQLVVDLHVNRVDSPEGGKLLQELLAEVRSLPGVKQALLVGGKEQTAVLVIVPQSEPASVETDELIHRLRQQQLSGAELLVTGGPAYRHDIVERIADGFPTVILFVVLATLVILMWAFRSLLLPLKAVLMNVFSLGASMGIVISVFQHGHFAEALGITSTGYVNATLPVIIFCVVFGISMDYEVFLLSRIAEHYEQTGDNERSTAEGLRTTGGLITSAALILIIVVGSFLFTDNELMKALGLGLGLAVLIDATVIRAAMVPALMKLMGTANWWAPRWMRPIRPKTERQV